MADENSPDVVGLIRAREATDPGYIARLIQIESGGNPNAVSGSYRGLGQFSPALESRYGITDANRSDPDVQRAAIARHTEANAAALRRTLGREPTQGELYLTHQQGVAGGPALLSADPTVPAWQAIRPFYNSDDVARRAITGNIPANHPLAGRNPDEITAGDFRNLWINRFERRPSAAATAPAAVAQGGTGPSQTGAVPVAPANAADGEDELLRTLQALSAPIEPEPQIASPAPMTINFPQPRGLQRARALALATGRRSIA